jgi:membrane protein DedA with SNARE-associated domain
MGYEKAARFFPRSAVSTLVWFCIWLAQSFFLISVWQTAAKNRGVEGGGF